jgi:hypothetical protein
MRSIPREKQRIQPLLLINEEESVTLLTGPRFATR